VIRQAALHPQFVTFAPATLEHGRLYVSMEYATALHLCCCGCGNKVITPLAPDKWSLLFDGQTVTLDPSIGNWSFPCQSHYWIRGSAEVWDRQFNYEEIETVRGTQEKAVAETAKRSAGASWWSKLIERLRR
jgi:hypothetical protein